jgi:hypothetical protein
MYKSGLTAILLLLFMCNAQAQKDSLSKADKAALDSMMKNDEFLKLMNGKDKDKNTLEISAGISNGAFSAHNKAINSTGIINQVIFTPSIVYRIKNGFSFGVAGYMANDSGSLSLYQTGLTGAYDYDGEKVKAGVSYTRYLSDQNKYNSKSLYQNDIYSYVKKASGIVQPGLALGFTSGNYKQVDLVKIRRPLIGDTITVRDSTDNKASFFSLSASIEHDFYLYKIFSPNDELDLVPAIILNAGNDKNTSTITNRLYQQFLSKRQNRQKRIASTDKFQLQSIAASLEVTYGIGKFFFQPNIYFDYYLPSTTAKRFTTIYSVTAGLSF